MTKFSSEAICLITLTLAMCMQRLSIAVGNILYGISVLFFLLHLYQRHKAGEQFFVSKENKQYFKVYGLFILFLLPSVIFSIDPMYSLRKYIDIFYVRFLVLVMLLFLKVDVQAIKKALLTLIVYIGFDGIITFAERLITHAPRVHGLGDGWLRHASIVSTVFPSSVILWMQRSVRFPMQKYLIISSVFITLGALGSGTRSSWVGILSVIPFIWAAGQKMNKKKATAIIVMLFCLLGFVFTTPVLRQRAQSITDITTNRSNGDRVEAWKQAAVMVKDRPVTGYGILRSGRVYLAQYRTVRDTQGLGHFHNIYVQTAADSGLLGLFGLMIFLGYNFWQWRHLSDPYCLILFCSWLGFCVVGMFDYTIGMSAALKTLWFVTGCCMRLKEDNN